MRPARGLVPAALVALVACQVADQFQGDEVDFFDGAMGAPEDAPQPAQGSNDAEFTGAHTIDDISATCDAEALQTGEPTLELTGAAGVIEVRHTGVDTWCETDWAVDWWGEGQDIWVQYRSVTENDDPTCACAWTLSYTLEGVPAGTYTVHTTRGEGEVTVP